MSKMFGLDILRYISSTLFVFLLGFLAFQVNNGELQKVFGFFLNGMSVILLFSSGFLFAYDMDTLAKQDSINYFVHRFKQLVPMYIIAITLTYIVSIFTDTTAIGLYEDQSIFNINSIVRDYLLIVDIQNGNFIYPIIYHAWPILMEVSILYLVFFYLVFKENSKHRKTNDIYRDIIIFIVVVSVLSIFGINQFTALNLTGVPDLIKGFIFLILNDNLILLSFLLGIITALFSKTKKYKSISNQIKVGFGFILLIVSIIIIYQSLTVFLSGSDVVPLQVNGSPKVYYLIPSMVLLSISFILLEPMFIKFFNKRKSILRYAYTQFLLSDIIVYQSIAYFVDKYNLHFSTLEKLGIITILIVLLHILSYMIYKVVDKYVYENKLFKELSTNHKEDEYVRF